MAIAIKETKDITKEKILALYQSANWSSAEKPDVLYKALLNSHSLVSAWDGEELVGLGNAISDGHLVVYYPHLVVMPEYQNQGIGSMVMKRLRSKYMGFHQEVVLADGRAVKFYLKAGFSRAGSTVPLWKYEGKDHD